MRQHHNILIGNKSLSKYAAFASYITANGTVPQVDCTQWPWLTDMSTARPQTAKQLQFSVILVPVAIMRSIGCFCFTTQRTGMPLRSFSRSGAGKADVQKLSLSRPWTILPGLSLTTPKSTPPSCGFAQDSVATTYISSPRRFHPSAFAPILSLLPGSGHRRN